MLVIRLIRTGKKNASSFRIVLTEKTNAPKSGKFLEILGSYNSRLRVKNKDGVAGKKEITLKNERIEYWLSKGAKASDTVHNLLVSHGVIKGPKIAKKIKAKKSKRVTEDKKPTSGEEPVAEDSDEEKKSEKKTKAKEPAEDIQPEEKPAEKKKSDKKEEKKDKKEDKPKEEK